MFSKNNNQQSNKIEYVVKFGYNGVVTKRFACKSLLDIDNFNFDSNCNVIEIYRQVTEAKIVRDESTINENALIFMARLFKGDFIPTLQAMQLPCEKTSVNPTYKNEYNTIVKNLVPKEAAGIISIDGHPYMANVKNTFYIDSIVNGKIQSVCNLDSLYLSAEAKYQAILDGEDFASASAKINSRSPIHIAKLTDVLKK